MPEPALWGAVIASECRLSTRLSTVFALVLDLACLLKLGGLLVVLLLDRKVAGVAALTAGRSVFL